MLVKPFRLLLADGVQGQLSFFYPEIDRISSQITIRTKDFVRISLVMPFGADYWPAATLLFFKKQLIILRSFTITHILITVGFPAILLMPIINNTWKYFPPNIILYLTHLLGLLFIIIAFKKRIEN